MINMSELVPIFASGIIGALSGTIGAYVIAKKMLSTDKILTISEEILAEVAQNEQLQKKIYIIGALLGKGIQAGVGLNPKSGKFKMEDIIGLAISQFLPKVLGNLGGQTTSEQQEQGLQGLFQ